MTLGRAGLWQQQVPSVHRSERRTNQQWHLQTVGRRCLGRTVPQHVRQMHMSRPNAAHVTMQAAPSETVSQQTAADQSSDARADESAEAAVASSSAVTYSENGAAADTGAVVPSLVPGAVADVEELCGVRVNVDDLGQPLVDYLVHWKVGMTSTATAHASSSHVLQRCLKQRRSSGATLLLTLCLIPAHVGGRPVHMVRGLLRACTSPFFMYVCICRFIL